MKMELLVVLAVFAMCGAFIGIWRIQNLDEPQTSGISVLKVEKQRAEKPVEKEGYVAEGRIPVIFNK